MSNFMLQSEAQRRRIEPYFPLLHGVQHVDDRLVLSGIAFILRNGCDGAKQASQRRRPKGGEARPIDRQGPTY